MDRELAVELERDSKPHYYHLEGDDEPGAYLVPARLFEQVLRALRGECKD